MTSDPNSNAGPNPVMAAPRRQNQTGSSNRLFTLYVVLVLLFIFTPIVVVIRYAFNPSEYFTWPPSGYTLDWFEKALSNKLLVDAFRDSVIIAVATTAISTVLGISTAFGIVRFLRIGKRALNALVLLPIITYGIIASVSLLLFFNMLDVEPGVVTTIIGHTTYLFSFIVLIVAARLLNFDLALEEASMDLGAHPARTFFDITLPLITPAVVAGALFVFTLSFDDFILSYFLIGNHNTLPTYIFAQIRYFLTPEVNAVATIVIGISMIFAVLIGFFFGDIEEVY
jgi:spermidine/putrescine transport system permease protein